MNKKASSKTGKTLGEFTLIVIGVLVALFAESWWSEREDRAAEQAILKDGVPEFRENIDILTADIATNNALYDLLTTIRNTPDDELLALSDQQATDLFKLEQQIDAAFDPALGSIDALVRAGNLQFVEDERLRQLLTRWSTLLTKSDRLQFHHAQYMNLSIFLLVPSYDADNLWTEDERRHMRAILGTIALSMTLGMKNMETLKSNAIDIHERLIELTQ